jgi:hypothetical protein
VDTASTGIDVRPRTYLHRRIARRSSGSRGRPFLMGLNCLKGGRMMLEEVCGIEGLRR